MHPAGLLRGSVTASCGSAGTAGGAFAGFEAARVGDQGHARFAEATVKLTATTGMSAKEASTWIEVMKVHGVAANKSDVIHHAQSEHAECRGWLEDREARV